VQDNKKNITPFNHKGAHGYWESYWKDGTLSYRGFYVNHVRYGYSQLYETNEVYGRKEYYAKL
jgi:REP element-mobilizing transposase RayT